MIIVQRACIMTDPIDIGNPKELSRDLCKEWGNLAYLHLASCMNPRETKKISNKYLIKKFYCIGKKNLNFHF